MGSRRRKPLAPRVALGDSIEFPAQGDPQVLEALNEVLTAELTAINQYLIYAKMCVRWGDQRLARKKREESIEEMKDAAAVIERILQGEEQSVDWLESQLHVVAQIGKERYRAEQLGDDTN